MTQRRSLATALLIGVFITACGSDDASRDQPGSGGVAGKGGSGGSNTGGGAAVGATGGGAGSGGSGGSGGASGANSGGSAGLVASDFNWYPGYYVLGASRESAAKQKLIDDPLVAPFDGVQYRYLWSDCELAPGDFSAGFAQLDEDLQRVAAANKKILVMLMYKTFDDTPAVPSDLRTGPGVWCNASYCGEFVSGTTHVALLWNDAVEARLAAWISAIAAHLAKSSYLERVAGIVTNETSIPKDMTALSAASFDPYKHLAAVQQNLLGATTSAPKLITFCYFEGGFMSMDGSTVNAPEKMGDWMLLHPHTGLGTPDLISASPNLNHPCINPKYQTHIPCDPAIEAPDYATINNASIDQAFAYAQSPAPTGFLASLMTFSYKEGPGPNAFTFADVSAYIPTHPMPNTKPPTW